MAPEAPVIARINVFFGINMSLLPSCLRLPDHPQPLLLVLKFLFIDEGFMNHGVVIKPVIDFNMG